jgi:alpha-beta hydrolase superfamily lysophospholipase
MTPKHANAQSTRANTERFSLTGTDGVSVACVKRSGRGRLRGVVQIAHGLGEHVGRFGELIESLVDQEFAVYGNDHRGHGLTARSAKEFGDFGPRGFDQLVEDMVSLRIIAKNDHPHLPYILLGHSLGSFAAQQLILEHSHSIDGLALSGSCALEGLARFAHGQPPNIAMARLNAGFEPARTPFDWLSRDAAEVDAFVADPLCFPSLQPESMESFLGAARRLSDPFEMRNVRQTLPVYIFSGSDDPVGQRLEGVRALIDHYRNAGIRSVDHDFYPGGRHEMLHEKNRRGVIARLLSWMTRVVDRAA